MSDEERKTKRERRRPEESEREILDAAEQFLRERPLSEITVGELMVRTRLGRSSFYFYFNDLYDLVARLLAGLEPTLWEPAERWIGGSEGLPEEYLRRALGGVVSVWVAHGPVLRAIAEVPRQRLEYRRTPGLCAEPGELACLLALDKAEQNAGLAVGRRVVEGDLHRACVGRRAAAETVARQNGSS